MVFLDGPFEPWSVHFAKRERRRGILVSSNLSLLLLEEVLLLNSDLDDNCMYQLPEYPQDLQLNTCLIDFFFIRI